MNPRDRLRVIDDEPATKADGRKGRKPPFKVGAIVTCKTISGDGPLANVELREHRGYWRAHRFAPADA